MLRVEDLSAGYHEHMVINHINFTLPEGRILGVIGPNGSGKSTLIRAISGILPLQEGKVWVGDLEITSLSAPQRARHLAVVPQAMQLPEAFTARETVTLGRTPYLNWLGQLSQLDEKIINQAMDRTQTRSLSDRRIGELSGGEQQRLLLGRALAQSTPVLLLDEPTAHLDLKYQISLLDEIRKLSHYDGLTVLLVLHDLNLVARYADQVALMVNGNLQDYGPPENVLTSKRLSEVYSVPLQVMKGGFGGPPIILPKTLRL